MKRSQTPQGSYQRIYRKALSALLALLLLFGFIPPAPFAAAADDHWKIMQIDSAETGATMALMKISAQDLNEVNMIKTSPFVDNYILNISMQYTQRYDLKLYALKDNAQIEVGAPWYADYFSQVSSETVNYSDLHDPGNGRGNANDFMWNETRYADDPDYAAGTDTDDPRGEFLGYLWINDAPAEDLVLAGFDGPLAVDPLCTITGGITYETLTDKYQPLSPSASDEERNTLYARQIAERDFIIVEESTSGKVNRLLWDGTIVNNGEHIFPPSTLDEAADVRGQDLTELIKEDIPDLNTIGRYVVVAEPKGVDLYRVVTEPEIVGYDEDGNPIYDTLTRIYPGGGLIDAVPANPATYLLNWARHYVSMVPVQFDYAVSSKDLGLDLMEWLRILGEKISLIDPVNIITGNFLWEYTDLAVNSATPLQFTRYYNSQEDYGDDEDRAKASPLGYGWRHTYQYTLERGDYSATVQTANGYQINFSASFQTPGKYVNWSDPKYVLEKAGSDYRLSTPYAESYLFDEDGRLIAIEKLGVPQVTLDYAGDHLTTVTAKETDAQLTFSYSGNHITEITDHSSLNRSVKFTYDSGGNLTRATNPDGDSLSFVYDDDQDRHNLTQIIDFAGELYLENTYDKYDRVIEQFMPTRGTSEISYDPGGQVNTLKDYSGQISKYYYDQHHRLVKREDKNGALLVTQSYDQGGRLIEQSDALGQVTKYDYDDLDRLLKTTYPDGQAESLEYTDAGQLQKQTFTDYSTVAYEYDAHGNVTRLTDQRGNEYSFTYDGLDHLTTLTDRLGHTTRYNYDNLGQPISVTDPENHTTAYEYDDLGRLTALISPEGIKTSYEYSAAGKCIAVTDQDGNRTEYSYDANGYPTGSRLDWGGGQTKATANLYDNLGNILSHTDPLGHTTTYAYQAGGGQISLYTDPENYSASYSYDEQGNLKALTDRRGYSTGYSYDPLNRLQTINDPEGGHTDYRYDDRGRVAAVNNPLNQETSYAYDPAGRLKSVTDPLGHSLRYAYDANGNVTRFTNQNNHETSYEYDAEDRLISSTDALGQSTTYRYDAAGRLLQTTDTAGRTRRVDLDRDGNILSLQTPLPQVTYYEYDGSGRLSREILPDGVTELNYTYDQIGRLIERSNVGGGSTRYEYDLNDNLITVTDPLNALTRLTYTARGELESVTDPLGNITRYRYDPEGNLSAVTDAAGFTTTYTYDRMNRLASEKDGRNHTIGYRYDLNGNLISIQNPDGGNISYQYDAANRVTAVTDGEGNTTEYQYDNAGNLTRATDPLNHSSKYAYDRLERLESRVDAAGNRYQLVYDAAGRISSATDEESVTTSYSYDVADRLTGVTDGLGHSRRYYYDVMDRLTAATDENGVTRYYQYDAAGNLTGYTDGNGVTFEYEYDELGRRLLARAPSNVPGGWVTTGYTYDALGRVIQTTDNQNHEVKFSYDALGRIAAVEEYQTTAPLVLSKTTYSYDAAGNLIRTADENGQVTTYGYDPLNRLNQVNISGSSPQVTVYRYDHRGLVTETIAGYGSALAASEQRSYDEKGNLLTVIDADGNVIDYTHDVLDRVETISSSAGDLLYVYNATGELVEMTDPQGITEFAYDALKRLTKVTDHNQRTVQYGYDNIGNVKRIVYPDTTLVEYAYDQESRLLSVTEPDGDTTYTYNQAGNLDKVHYPTGEEATYTYNDLNQVTNIVEKLGNISRRIYGYTYDDAGNLKSESRQGIGFAPVNQSSTFAYDRSTQLTQTGDSIAGATNYAYDLAGNLISETLSAGPYTLSTISYSYNSRNELTAKNDNGIWSSYSYDRRGNLIRENTAGQSKTYTYDALGRMVKGVNEDGDASEYLYNGLGLRVANIQTIQGENRANYDYRNLGNGPGSFHIGNIDDLALNRRSDTGQEVYTDNYGLTRQNETQEIMRSYIPDYASDPTRELMIYAEGHYQTSLIYGLEGLLKQKTTHLENAEHPLTGVSINTTTTHQNILSDNAVTVGTLYHHTNRLSSADYTADLSGEVRSWADYDTWGVAQAGVKHDLNLAVLTDTAAYTGYTYDQVLDVYFAQYRFYDPNSRRFTSEDPLRSGRNWYAYVGNDPMNFVDPWGLREVILSEIAEAFGAKVSWDSFAKNATVTFDGRSFLYTSVNDSDAAYLNESDNRMYIDNKVFLEQWGLSYSESQLQYDLNKVVTENTDLKQKLAQAGFNNTAESLRIVLNYDSTIAVSANMYNLNPALIQTVLFQEIRFYNFLDILSDTGVMDYFSFMAQYEKYKQLEPWQQFFSFPHFVFPNREDSSTGLGQIFARTAIDAITWYEGDTRYNFDDWQDRQIVWNLLHTNNEYNIQMVGLVLAFGADDIKLDIGSKKEKDIMKIQNQCMSREENIILAINTL
jgi:RHS repeat-associated protein